LESLSFLPRSKGSFLSRFAPGPLTHSFDPSQKFVSVHEIQDVLASDLGSQGGGSGKGHETQLPGSVCIRPERNPAARFPRHGKEVGAQILPVGIRVNLNGLVELVPIPSNSARARPTWCKENASSGQRKARRKADFGFPRQKFSDIALVSPQPDSVCPLSRLRLTGHVAGLCPNFRSAFRLLR
jgi:hypothetical protein